MELPWDGSYLSFTLKEFEEENGIKYGKIVEYDANCIYIKGSSCKLPIIYDKLKPLFGIRPTGCHYNEKYIVFRPYEKDGIFLKEIRLSDFNTYDKLKYNMVRDIRKIICFRYFFFLTHITERNILYRDTYVLSYDDKKGKTNTGIYVLPERIRKQWFSEISIDRMIYLMFKQYHNTINCELRIKVKKIIKKIDRNCINLSSEFCDRLTNICDHVKSQELHGRLEYFNAEESRDNTN